MTMLAHEVALVKQCVRWRRTIETSFKKQGKNAARKLALSVVEGLVFLKLAQLRKLEPSDGIARLRGAKNLTVAFEKVFSIARIKYRSSLFNLPPLNVAPLFESALRKVLRKLHKSALRKFSPSILGKIYETDPNGSRNSVYFTPDFISEYLVRETLTPLLRINASPSVLDLACGAGAFLLKAFDFILLKRGRRSSVKLKSRILLTSIHGVDIDAIAVEFARLSLLLMLYKDNAPARNAPLLDLSANIRCADALTSTRFDEAKETSGLNWTQSFPIVAKAHGFDAVIVNPPYINVSELTREHGAALRNYLAKKYQCARGGYDLFVLFAEISLGLLRPHGRLGLIAPNKLAHFRYADSCRKMLLSQTRIDSIVDLTQMCHFSKQSVYPYILICEIEHAAPLHRIDVVDACTRADLKPGASVSERLQSELSQNGFQIHGAGTHY